MGSSLAITLARLGVGEMTLIDPDVLEEHNLENQAYDERDLGKPKVQALRERILAIDPTIRVRTVASKIQDYRGPLDVNWLLGGLDNVAARHYLGYVAVANDKVLIDAGIDGFRGVVKTIVPWVTACQACIPMLVPGNRKASCSKNPIPSTYITASVTANLQAMQFLKLLRGEPYRSHLSIDLARGTLFANHFASNPACEICGGA